MFAFESAILLALQSARIPFFTQLLALISALSNKAFIWIAFAIVIVLFSKGSRIQGLYIIVGVLLCYLIGTLLLSNLIARPRPYTEIIGLNCWYGTAHEGYSCPSFHAMVSCCSTVIIYKLYGKRLGIIALILTLLICFSRIFLGVHYLSDVLLGMVIGFIIGCATLILCTKILANITLPQPQRKSVSRKKVTGDHSIKKEKK